MSGPVSDKASAVIKAVEKSLEQNGARLVRIGSYIALFVAGSSFTAIALITLVQPQTSSHETLDGGPVATAAFVPPDLSAIPDGPEGEAIKRGKAIFDETKTHAADFVGNAMACRNCHLDSGRRPNSSPMWAAWVGYPQYRKKNNSINTMEDRIQGCFRYSMNAPNSPSGGPPPAGSDIYRDLQAYFYWLAKGAPTGQAIAGAGFPKPQLAASGYDPGRGSVLYEQKCSGCHGSGGEGAIQPDGKVIYPPLWGPQSYNWGAGMARIDLAAGFIKANMPFDAPGTLSDQEAWDIAAFVDSHERPRDPRQTGSVAENARLNFDGQATFYGKQVNGTVLGAGVSSAR